MRFLLYHSLDYCVRMGDAPQRVIGSTNGGAAVGFGRRSEEWKNLKKSVEREEGSKNRVSSKKLRSFSDCQIRIFFLFRNVPIRKRRGNSITKGGGKDKRKEGQEGGERDRRGEREVEEASGGEEEKRGERWGVWEERWGKRRKSW